MVLYRLLQLVLIPAMLAHALWQVLRRGESARDLRERIFGPSTQGPVIWIHGASLGELASARQVITALAQENGGRILVTTTRKPALDALRSWDLPGVMGGLAPLDSIWITRRFLRRNDVTRFVVLENELWPARLATCHQAGVPVVLLSARMSDRTARQWHRFGSVATSILPQVARVLPQDDRTAMNLITLGVPADRFTPVVKLKAGYVASDVKVPGEFNGWSRDTTLLAAATHDGEEAIVLDAFALARKKRPDLRLIIAPRHAERGEAIAALIAERGYPERRRSKGAKPDAPIYVADTMGEMLIWYQMAGIAFIGGSLVPKGGHTPYEPAAHGCPILHGPHLDNFAEDYARFAAADAAITVNDADSLAAAFLTHCADDAMAARARSIASPLDIPALVQDILRA